LEAPLGANVVTKKYKAGLVEQCPTLLSIRSRPLSKRAFAVAKVAMELLADHHRW
jgi:hypothetical protein